MFLKILVLVASFGQVIAASYLDIGAFQDAERIFPVFIQPAGWAFSIWGVIYALSFVYGVYQIIPKYDNDLLQVTRLPALIGFVGSGVWLYFAGMSDQLVWLTVPVLFGMAYTFTKIVTAKDSPDTITTILSKSILLPYAAWTGIACWINVQALLVEKGIITDTSINFVSNILLFIGIVGFTLYYFRKSGYTLWYGGVMLWASIGVLASNVLAGSLIFVGIAGLFIFTIVGILINKRIL